jgi:hypothetical protein
VTETHCRGEGGVAEIGQILASEPDNRPELMRLPLKSKPHSTNRPAMTTCASSFAADIQTQDLKTLHGLKGSARAALKNRWCGKLLTHHQAFLAF